MVLSKRTLKRMENLKDVCTFDTVNEVATLNIHFSDISEIFDERLNSENRLIINEETLELLDNGLEIIPDEFRVNYDVSIDNCKDIDAKTIEDAFKQAIDNRNYKKSVGKMHKRSVMCIFVVIGLIFLVISKVAAQNNMFEWVGLSFSAIIAFVLELIFEVYFDEGVTHFVITRIYEKFGYNNRFGIIHIK